MGCDTLSVFSEEPDKHLLTGTFLAKPVNNGNPVFTMGASQFLVIREQS